MSLISYHSVDIHQQEAIVLENVNLEIGEGEFVYLIGPVGSGKSSLLKTMYAELDIHSGQAEVLGYDMRHIRRSQIPALRKRIGIVFQDFQLLIDRNVHDNLDFVLRATGWKERSRREQRIVSARAILNKPDIILADEPTGNLDAETGKRIVELLRSIRDSGSTVIMSTHNLTLLEAYPARACRCENHSVIDCNTEPAPSEL